ncbi:MAG: hypothetical protein ACRD22_16705 [Terriglobia bacterium]
MGAPEAVGFDSASLAVYPADPWDVIVTLGFAIDFVNFRVAGCAVADLSKASGF